MTKGDSSTECESSALVCPSMIGTTRGGVKESHIVFCWPPYREPSSSKHCCMNATSGGVSQAPKQKMFILV